MNKDDLLQDVKKKCTGGVIYWWYTLNCPSQGHVNRTIRVLSDGRYQFLPRRPASMNAMTGYSRIDELPGDAVFSATK